MTNTPQQTTTRGPGRLRIAAWSAAALVLLAPLAAMQFTDEVRWQAGDFVIAALLLAAVGLAAELAVRRTASAAWRTGVGVALAAALLLVWTTLAVGIIGSEHNDANLMFAGVLAVGLVGAAVARLRPRGLARALLATALAQAAAGAVALAGGLGTEGALWPWDVAGATVFFTGLWLLAANRFRAAARERGA